MVFQPFIIRSLQDTDIEDAMRLSVGAGWNQTAKDWKFFIGNTGNICLAIEYNKKIIATTIAINYPSQACWISMVLVDKEHRGNGLSKLLLTTIFEKLQEFTSIKLDATPQGEPVYKKFDFKNEYSIARMVNMTIKRILPEDDFCTLVPVQLQDLQEIIALDQCVFGANRADLIQFMVKEYPDRAWLLKQQDRITGFILGRDGCRYHHIGPLMAASTNHAKILITNALQHLIHQAVVLDVPYDKASLISWLTTMGFTQQRHFTRMYKKENPLPGIPGQQYLICGPEFG